MNTKMRDAMQDWAMNDETGATSVEYAILVSLIALVIFTSVTLFGTAVVGLFTRVLTGMSW